jgi:hypothetical protein
MAKRQAAKKQAAAGGSAKDSKPKVVVLAEKLGTFLGRVQNKADGLLKRGGAKKAARKPAAAAEAPVKRLRKPPPQELFDPRLGEPMGKQMGQKNLKRRRSS